MSTRSKDDGIITINGWRIAAVITQFFSYLATYGFIRALGGKDVDTLGAVGLALVIEFLLMAGKALVFLATKNKSDALGWISVLFDTLLNAGGVWPFVQNGDDTPTWVMIAEGLQLERSMANIPALLISLIIGFFLAVAPFIFWKRGD